jgi:hypothetical protein
VDNVCRLPARHPMVSARVPGAASARPGGAAGPPCVSRQVEGLASLLEKVEPCYYTHCNSCILNIFAGLSNYKRVLLSAQVKQLQHEERARLQHVTQQAPQARGALPTMSLPGPPLAAAVLWRSCPAVICLHRLLRQILLLRYYWPASPGLRLGSMLNFRGCITPGRLLISSSLVWGGGASTPPVTHYCMWKYSDCPRAAHHGTTEPA